MDLKHALQELVEGFDANGIDAALIGGFALGALGMPRATMDIDFLVDRAALDELEPFMTGLGYKKEFVSENVSQYVHAGPDALEVDFLHAFRPVSMKMLREALSVDVFGGGMKVKVLRPEDIIGLKVQAIVNNPDRKNRDTADIEALAVTAGLDWPRIGSYYSMFGMEKDFEALKSKYDGK
ncbi:MAG: nucleotidyl transferase AbiEii/AbiGii toxin family protein [Elusimicrobiales bacterium]|nr:nucleotidyl transferase AbiEii/AbiGii toxin family protein [Elusimicrobiales bacterium]